MVKPAEPVTEAGTAFAQGDAARAESVYAAQLAGPASMAAYAGLVKSQLQLNKLTEAVASADKAIAAMPTSAEAYALSGDALLRAGRLAEATTAFTKALSLDPCSARGQFGTGRIADAISRHATAARKYGLAHTLAPDDPEIAAALAMTMHEEQKAAMLRGVVAAKPVVAPATLEKLKDELAMAEQHVSCSLSQPFKSAKLDLEPIFFNGTYPRSWGVKVRVNDVGSPLLELDPTVEGIVLSSKEAEHDDVHRLRDAPAGPGGRYLGVAAHVRIGAQEYRNCPVTVVPPGTLANHNGLIGTSFFRDHTIHIDFVAKLLSLDAYATGPGAVPGELTDRYVAPEEKDWTPAYIVGPSVVLPTLINGKGMFLFALDTGTFDTVVAPQVAVSQLSATEDLSYNLMGTSGAIVKVMARDGGPATDHPAVHGDDGALLQVLRPRRNLSLHFDNNEYGDTAPVSYDISDKSRATGIELSGLLGFWVLQNFIIDINYRDGLVHIPYDINHRYWVRYVNNLN